MNDRKRTAIIIIVIVVCAVLAVGMRIVTRQTVVIKNNPPPQTTTQDTKAAQTLESSYFTTTLLPDFSITKQQEISSGNELYQAIVSKAGSSYNQLAIQIGKLPQEGLEGVASYAYRSKNDDVYNKQEFAGMPSDAIAFFGTGDTYELTVFWPHGDTYVSISATGQKTDSDELNSLLSTSLNRWRWKY